MEMERLSKCAPMNLSSLLTDQEALIHTKIKNYATTILQPQILLPTDSNLLIKRMLKDTGDLGIMRQIISVGKNQLSAVGYGLVTHEIEGIDSASRTSFSADSSLVLFCIDKYGTEEMKSKYLQGLASGELIGCFAVTEPGHGSDTRGIDTIAVLGEDGNFRINGTKHWITNCTIADVLIIWAKTEQSAFEGFVLDKDTLGMSTTKMDPMFCMNNMVVGSIQLKNVIAPESSRLKGNGIKTIYACNNIARFGISWGAMGAARSCYNSVLDYINSKQDQINPQWITKLEKIAIEFRISLLSCYHAGRLIEKGAATHVMINVLKRNSCKTALQIARTAREIIGESVCSEKYAHVRRHCHNLEAVNSYEGTEDIHALVIGRAVTGLQAFF